MFENAQFDQDPDFQRLTPEAQDQVRRNRSMNSQRGQIEQQTQEYRMSRDPYYEALRAQSVQAAAPQLQQQYSDALRQQQLSAASRGTAGGSQDYYNQALLHGQLQAGYGQADLRGQAQAQQAKGQDEQLINDWLSHAQSLTSGEQAGAQQRTGGVQDQQNALAQFQQAMLQSMQSRQQFSNAESQMVGGQISTIGNAAKARAGAG